MVIRRIARPLLSVAFIGQGVNSLLNPKSAAAAAAPAVDGLQALPNSVSGAIPSDPETFAQINAAVQIGGGLLLATGKLPRVASAALAFTVLPANLGAHSFWNESDPQAKAQKRQQFLTDLSLVGGLLIASADTAGKPSLGWRGRRAAERLSERVSSALPGSDDGFDTDFSELGEKIVHGLQVGAERGRELASTAAERGAPYAEAALERGREFASTAADRSKPLAKKARKRGEELADEAADWAAPLAKKARKRGEELADEAADWAAPLAKKARKRSEKLAKKARKRGEELASTAVDRGEDLADTARARGTYLAETARARGGYLADTARERVGEQVKAGRRKLS
ncbi:MULTISPECIES: DoxX family protein [unclassified Mycobacterium]|uniref:DoxX family protein n=1 Tax=unclassified Mycobacterium TaxID=2642494 RepID=UPI0007FF7C88|nr:MULTISPECIES: DoxX family protein [unclassified Mycobacterium]OBG58697.1 DoxX subfamily protein [Mycobacterium sp. E735]OBG64893.1 DoxX subfamily protein [Mycobacterium sp. E188]OBG69192.1 DoxX subfamily protein [Mycobacterium sp. E3305]OBG93041.1 DoxX subfamily protein [Mycobacterium sp. E3298]OBH25666.1 DoxX subfamily protein [Mycobacterium sp. E1715]